MDIVHLKIEYVLSCVFAHTATASLQSLAPIHCTFPEVGYLARGYGPPELFQLRRVPVSHPPSPYRILRELLIDSHDRNRQLSGRPGVYPPHHDGVAAVVEGQDGRYRGRRGS